MRRVGTRYPHAHVIDNPAPPLRRQSQRQGSRELYLEYLKGALHFFRTGRPTATYALLCATLVALAGARLAVGWARRDTAGVNAARRVARVAWNGLVNR